MKHQKAGRKNGTVAYPKGRKVNATALERLRGLLPATLQRDMLIEYLHTIQHKFHCLSQSHLEALAELMNLPFAEVYEVATFYAHFNVVEENAVEDKNAGEDKASPNGSTNATTSNASTDTTPQVATNVIRVCDSLSCELNGAKRLLATLTEQLTSPDVRVEPAPCMGYCHKATAVMVNETTIANATAQKVTEALSHPSAPVACPAPQQKHYTNLQKFRDGGITLKQLLATLTQADLRGMGGAGFPTAKKIELVNNNPPPRIMTVNADEGEPGTFKDRQLMAQELPKVLEGMLIAAEAVQADAVYFYIRGEYPELHAKLATTFAELQRLGINGKIKLHLRLGAGAYICGEESAMIESIEGKRGLPRHRPPYIASKGVFGLPTLNHNVETLYWISEILTKGADWYASQGQNGSKGLRAYSVSGRVAKAGVAIAPLGITLNQLITDHCGGMAKGHTLKGYLPGGASGGILPASMADEPLSFGSLEKHGCFVGSGAVIVFSNQDSIKQITLNLLKFFEDESCGQCTPCRVGTEKSVQLLKQNRWDKALLQDTINVMSDASICGLGQAAGNPIACAMKYFSEEL